MMTFLASRRWVRPCPGSIRDHFICIRFICTFGLLALMSFAQTAADEGKDALTLVQDGQSRAIIITSRYQDDPANPQSVPALAQQRMYDHSARYLSDTLHEISGGEFPIISENKLVSPRIENGRLVCDSHPAQVYLIVGDGALAQQMGLSSAGMGMGGLVLKSSGNVIGLLGMADSTTSGGATYAVVELLERLGCRYLWPGRVGRVLPQMKTITLEPLDFRYEPKLKERVLRSKGPNGRSITGAKALGITKTDDQWKQWFRDLMTVDPNVRPGWELTWGTWQRLGGDVGIEGGHAFGYFYEKFGQDHPGWFALQPDGSRRQESNHRARLCISNTDLIDHIANQIIQEASEDPTQRSVSLSPNDGGSDQFCMCEVNAQGLPGCRTLDPANAPKLDDVRHGATHSLTDRYVWFWNQIAQRVVKVHPHMLFTIDAYSAYKLPPVERQLHPNLVVRYVGRMEDWDEWSQKASKIYWRPNLLHAGSDIAIMELRKRDLNWLKHALHHGAFAIDVDSITHSWATRGMDYYLWSRLAWNPDLEIDAIIRDYCDHGFGKAAQPMYQYFQKMAELTEARLAKGFDDAPEGEYVLPAACEHFGEVYTDEAMKEMANLLDAADVVAAQEPEVRERIAFIRAGLEYSAMQAWSYRMLEAWERQGMSRDNFAALAPKVEARDQLLIRIFEEYPLAVNVCYMNWRNARLWRRFRGELAGWKSHLHDAQ